MFKEIRIVWYLKVDDEVKLLFIQYRSFIWTLLGRVKDSNLKFSSKTFSDAVK